jgi:hypothetical protein
VITKPPRADNARRTDALGQLQQRQGSQHHSHLLSATANQTAEFLLVVHRHLNTYSELPVNVRITAMDESRLSIVR